MWAKLKREWIYLEINQTKYFLVSMKMMTKFALFLSTLLSSKGPLLLPENYVEK